MTHFSLPYGGFTNSSGASSSIVKFAPKHTEEIVETGNTPLILRVPEEKQSLSSISESRYAHKLTNEELLSESISRKSKMPIGGGQEFGPYSSPSQVA